MQAFRHDRWLTLAALVGACLCPAHSLAADPDQVDVEALLDPALRWSEETIPPGQDAAPFLLMLRGLRDSCHEGDLADLRTKIANERRAWRAGAELDALERYVEQCQPVYQLIDEAVACGRWLPRNMREASAFLSDAGVTRRPLQLRIAWHASRGEFADAGRWAAQGVRLYQLGADGDGGMSLLLTSALVAYVNEVAEVYGERQALLAPVLAALQTGPAWRPETEARFVVHMCLPTLARQPARDADAVIKDLCHAPVPANTGEQVRAILAGHPEPWNQAAAIRLASDLFCEGFRPVAAQRERPLLRQVRQDLAAWPPELQLRCDDLLNFQVSEERTTVRLSDAGIAAARQKLATVKNVLGKRVVVGWTIPTFPSPGAQLALANRALYTTEVAVRLFRAQRGRSPTNLDEVVATRILQQVPNDPFAQPSAPIQYSASPPRVWSVKKGVERQVGGIASDARLR